MPNAIRCSLFPVSLVGILREYSHVNVRKTLRRASLLFGIRKHLSARAWPGFRRTEGLALRSGSAADGGGAVNISGGLQCRTRTVSMEMNERMNLIRRRVTRIAHFHSSGRHAPIGRARKQTRQRKVILPVGELRLRPAPRPPDKRRADRARIPHRSLSAHEAGHYWLRQ